MAKEIDYPKRAGHARQIQRGIHMDGSRALELNRAAIFESGDTPAIVVGGAAVHAYVKDGELVVSVHLDTGDVVDDLLTSEENVPTRINVNGETVFRES
jgi:hypothetical protein